MKPLDLTKPLQTCHGEKAELVYDGISGDYPLAVDVHSHDGTTTLRTYTREGSFYRGKGNLGNLMNVPEKRTFWVNIYKSGRLMLPHADRKSADDCAKFAGEERIACVEVTFNEGEGL